MYCIPKKNRKIHCYQYYYYYYAFGKIKLWSWEKKNCGMISTIIFILHYILRDSLPTLKLLSFLESFNCYWVYCQSKIPLSMTWLQYLARQFFYFYFCLLLVFRCHLIFFSLSTLIIPSIVNCCHGFHNKSRRKSRTTLLTKLNFQQFSMLANIFRHRCYCLQCVKYFQLDVACTVMKYKSDSDR